MGTKIMAIFLQILIWITNKKLDLKKYNYHFIWILILVMSDRQDLISNSI